MGMSRGTRSIMEAGASLRIPRAGVTINKKGDADTVAPLTGTGAIVLWRV
jgi:hypothetical protein